MVHILNRQKFCKPDIAKLKALVRFFLDKSAKAGGKSFYELSLLLTDDAGIRKINRQFLDRDCVTDVISFALPSAGVRSRRETAEVVINVERACLEGKKRRGIEHEFALYLAHGCDHLAGNSDRTASARNRMRCRELHWLKEAARHKFLSGLLIPRRKCFIENKIN